MDAYTKELTSHVSITAIIATAILLFAFNVRGCVTDSRELRAAAVQAAIKSGADPVRASCAYKVGADGGMDEACRAYLSREPATPFEIRHVSP